MLTLQNVTYVHPNKDLLFHDLTATVNRGDKVALIGNNGVGKSTLLRMLAGQLAPSSGAIHADDAPHYVPQHFGQFNGLTVSEALGIHDKMKALNRMADGLGSVHDLTVLNDDWNLRERAVSAMAYWGFTPRDLQASMETLSGGEKTKIFLAGILLHDPQLVLLDEPTNHLDLSSRQVLYEFLATTQKTMLIATHDQRLLHMLSHVYELTKTGIRAFGGNYRFYLEQKQIEENARVQELRNQEKALRKAKEDAREALERKQKQDARAGKKEAKAGMPLIMMNTMRDKAEKSASKLNDVHAQKIKELAGQVKNLRDQQDGVNTIKLDLDNSRLYFGKRLIEAHNINIGFERPLLRESLSLLITAGERIVIKGRNGSGKTTLIKTLTGDLGPLSGTINRGTATRVIIDQDYSLIDNTLTVFDQAQRFNFSNMPDHEISIRLNRFLFAKEYWDHPCGSLSGGEKMRLMLCCLMIFDRAPDIIILDEPTNNLDIMNTGILTAAIKQYSGTLIVVSHDEDFLRDVGVTREIFLD